MKNKLLWLTGHWYLIPLIAFAIMILLSLFGVRGPGARIAELTADSYYDGSGLVWQDTPGSTCFSAVGYDRDCEKLAVIFCSNESRAYVYSEFTASDWRDFLAADSLGTYYNTYIKGKYPSERYDDADALRRSGG